MFWWRAELDGEGSILNVEQVEQRAKGSAHVVYVEAVDKAAACTSAKVWYERYKAKNREYQKRHRERRKQEGRCGRCGDICAPSSQVRCIKCLEQDRVRDLLTRQGALMPPVKATTTGDEFFARREGYARAHKEATISIVQVLAKFDELEARPFARFRMWLIDEMNRRGVGPASNDAQAAE